MQIVTDARVQPVLTIGEGVFVRPGSVFTRNVPLRPIAASSVARVLAGIHEAAFSPDPNPAHIADGAKEAPVRSSP